MGWNPVWYLKSALCTAQFRLHRFKSALVGCEGLLPVLYSAGTVQVGPRLVVRGRISRCELGALAAGRLNIGARVFINQGSSIVASHHIEIGDDSQFGDFVAIYDSNHHSIDPYHPVKAAPVIIGANVWLGRGVVVLPGSRIGDHTVVAAGSVVRGDLPDRVLAAGNPATAVKKLDVPEGWRRG